MLKLLFVNKKYNLIQGTKWCGVDDKADNYNDLGKYERLDKCCRAHDGCAMSLKPGKSGWGLTNYWFHRRYIIL